MGYFSDNALGQLRREFDTVSGKKAVLQERYLQQHFCQDRAREFAHHGYIRRLGILARCIENVFALIPPDRTEPVDKEVRWDAEINIQASFFNVFGAVDNLAWIWVKEKNVKRSDGSELPDQRVGLRIPNRDVRASLPKSFLDYLTGLDDWFDMVDNYRHALAHRIPLYIPPFVVDPEDKKRHQNLEQEKYRELLEGNLVKHGRIQAEQKELEIFRPWMQHSFGEQARPLVFHPQLLSNFATIEEMGRKFLDALGA